VKRQARHERDLSSAVVSQHAFVRDRATAQSENSGAFARASTIEPPTPDLDEQRHGHTITNLGTALGQLCVKRLRIPLGGCCTASKGCVQCPGRVLSCENALRDG